MTFFQKGVMNRVVNATYIDLIPKKIAPQKASEFRPINLTMRHL